MGIIWEKADYLIRLLFIIVLGIACILIVIAPLDEARNNQPESGQEGGNGGLPEEDKGKMRKKKNEKQNVKKNQKKKRHDEKRRLCGHECYDEQHEQVCCDINIGQR